MLNGPQIILSLCLDIPSETVHNESCSVQTRALLITNRIGNNCTSDSNNNNNNKYNARGTKY